MKRGVTKVKQRIYVPGTFDLLHEGHLNLFRKAKEMGHVIVSVNTDEFVARFKRKPVMPLGWRMQLISELKCVDEVIVNEGCENSKPAILKSRATHILHGDEWKGESLNRQMGITQEWLDEQNIKMIFIPYTQGISTTKIIESMFHHEDLWTHV